MTDPARLPANTPRAPESSETRLKRLKLRSWRRGTREMDLIFGRWFDAEATVLSEADLDAYERLMEENDWDLYYWITGARETPERAVPLVERIARFHEMR
ncbi:MAG: succinate dehydrogenase assembly factor 2 [Pseudomonadota bacterium]